MMGKAAVCPWGPVKSVHKHVEERVYVPHTRMFVSAVS